MTDPIEDWWDATREQRLVVQRCSSCGHHQHYPRHVCTACGTDVLTLVDVSGSGSVWSFTQVHRAPVPDVSTPYTIALVRLDEGPVLLTHVTQDDPRCDERVHVHWRALDDGRHLPVFTREA
jgi:uncharacterized OB-fold protein